MVLNRDTCCLTVGVAAVIIKWICKNCILCLLLKKLGLCINITISMKRRCRTKSMRGVTAWHIVLGIIVVNCLLKVLFVTWILVSLVYSMITKSRTHHVTIGLRVSVMGYNRRFVCAGISIIPIDLLRCVHSPIAVDKVILAVFSIRRLTSIQRVYASANWARRLVEPISTILMGLNSGACGSKSIARRRYVNRVSLTQILSTNNRWRVILFSFIRWVSWWVTPLMSTAVRTLHLKTNGRFWCWSVVSYHRVSLKRLTHSLVAC